MLFVDGTWLWANVGRLGGRSEFKLDYGRLPQVLAAEVNRSLPSAQVHVVRTHLFGSYPSNYDPMDEESVRRQRDFLSMLTERFHYEVTLFPIDYRGRRVRWADRDPEDEFEPREKCVDISLATSMLYLAALPYAYDVAIAVIGDRDFVPVLQRVRDLAKRVAIASIRGACAFELLSPRDEARVKDFGVIWLDDLAGEIEYRDERAGSRSLPVEAGRMVTAHAGTSEAAAGEHIRLRGVIARLIPEKGYGFILGEDQTDYFFHVNDVVPGATFAALSEDDEVVFEVKRRPPAPGENGAARLVRPRSPEFTSL
jgi:cold shock CspA family protein